MSGSRRAAVWSRWTTPINAPLRVFFSFENSSADVSAKSLLASSFQCFVTCNCHHLACTYCLSLPGAPDFMESFSLLCILLFCLGPVGSEHYCHLTGACRTWRPLEATVNRTCQVYSVCQRSESGIVACLLQRNTIDRFSVQITMLD